jgi:hypothetical protein
VALEQQMSRSRLLIVALWAFAPLIVGGGCDPSTTLLVIGGNSFKTAALLTLDANGNAAISGNVTGDDPVVFDLGKVTAGDRIIVSVEAAAGSTLDPVLAVFDQNEELFALNDDVDLSAGLLGSAINDIVVAPGDSVFLAIAKFAFDVQGGAFEGTVRIERGSSVPTPPMQTFLLNFAGGSATIESEGTLTLDPFDAADIDSAYAGQTTTIKNRIVQVFKENFSATGAVVFSSDENPSLTPGTFSTIHFGAFSTTKFGVADGVDQGNVDRCDDGIVFTDMFDDPFAVQPTVEGISVAIANVAAHEAGHLLGLNHVADIIALMDNTGTASTLLADQNFKTAPLSPSVFPIGMQNAPAILDRVVPVP